MAWRTSCLHSAVMEAVIASESSWMPRKVRVVDGPSVFSCLMGTLMAEQAWSMASMLRWQVSEFGGPAVKKSSK